MGVLDGPPAALGATADAESASGNGSVVALLKRLRTLVAGGLPAALGANGALKVEGVASGTAQPVSASSLPLPAGAATVAKQPALGVAGTAATDVITVQGTAGAIAQPVSAASLPLPTGAATSAKQPAFGVAGAAATDVITVQGIASGTAQQVAGTVATTIADGVDVALGATSDATSANTVIGRLKKLVSLLPTALGSATSSASLPVVIASDQASVPVSGTVGTTVTDGGSVSIGATTDSTSANTVIGRLKNLLSRWPAALGSTTASGSLPVVIASDQGTVAVNGTMVKTSATFTRPADATAYAAKDAVSDSTSAPTVMTFANAARANGKGGYIVGVRVHTDQKTATARIRLHLYHTTPTAINDNAPYLLLYADRANRIGQVDMVALATEDPTNSTGAFAANFTDRIPFVAAAANTSLFAIMETLDALTPASGQGFYVELVIDQT